MGICGSKSRIRFEGYPSGCSTILNVGRFKFSFSVLEVIFQYLRLITHIQCIFIIFSSTLHSIPLNLPLMKGLIRLEFLDGKKCSDMKTFAVPTGWK